MLLLYFPMTPFKKSSFHRCPPLSEVAFCPVGKANKKEWTNNNQLLMLIIEIMVLNQLTYMHRI